MIECLITYDVNTQTREGERRLRLVAQACEGVGDRVQKSVFEFRCAEAQLVKLLHQLVQIIDERDSIRIYRLAAGSLDRTQDLGAEVQRQPRGARIF